MQFTSTNSISPSFTGNSSNNLADIAARVIEEIRNENGHHDDDDIYNMIDDSNHGYDRVEHQFGGDRVRNLKENEGEEDDDGEFEFAVVCRNPNSSSVSADEMFSNGEIVPRYPLFDRSLLLLDDVVRESEGNKTPEKVSPVVRYSLGKLFREERETASCSSSPEVDNLDGAAPETYCIWKPKVESPEKCKKSNSTGNSSKRWKFRNLLQRSHSDGNIAVGKKAPVVDLSDLTPTKKRSEKVKKVDKTAKVAGADDDGELTPVTDEITSANGTNIGVHRLRSYLRYKKDQIGV